MGSGTARAIYPHLIGVLLSPDLFTLSQLCAGVKLLPVFPGCQDDLLTLRSRATPGVLEQEDGPGRAS